MYSWVHAGRLSASWSHELAGLSHMVVFSKSSLFKMWVNGKLDTARKAIKKQEGDKVSICHSIFTASIFILSCIMRFAQNSSVCSQAEMSALGLSGWLCRSPMHANTPQWNKLQIDVEIDTKTLTRTVTLSCSLSVFSSLCRHLYL